MVLTSISVAISTRLPMLANLDVCILVFFLGHLSPVLVDVAGQTHVKRLVSFMAKLFAWAPPALEFFNAGPSISSRRGHSVVRLCLACIPVLRVVRWAARVVSLVFFEDRDLA